MKGRPCCAGAGDVMKVYVVTYTNYWYDRIEDVKIEKVFKNEKSAEKFVKENGNAYYSLHEMELED